MPSLNLRCGEVNRSNGEKPELGACDKANTRENWLDIFPTGSSFLGELREYPIIPILKRGKDMGWVAGRWCRRWKIGLGTSSTERWWVENGIY